jgi:hypothetical protein
MSTWMEAITSPLKAASETVQGLVNVRDQIKLGDTVIKLQAQILSAQQGASSAQSREMEMTEEIRSLKARVAELETWETEKTRYALDKLPPGVFVLSLKPDMAGTEPAHSICQTCYQRGKKSILHSDEPGNGIHHLTCHECNTVLDVGHYVQPRVNRGGDRQGGGPNSWMGV